MKTILVGLLTIGAAISIYAGGEPLKQVITPTTPPPPLYHDSEFDFSLLGAGSWTQTTWISDRYLGVDHTFGGTLLANYFFLKYFGAGLGFSGYDVRNISTPARVSTSNSARRFVGDLLVNATFRYPIGNTGFAPYVRAGAGTIFNGGNKTLQEPTGSAGQIIQFEKVEHDAQVLLEGTAGVEYRFNHTFGVMTEAAFDKVTRPQSNFVTFRAGINVAF